MANCFICGKKIGGFLEDKLTLEPGKECCYSCAPLIRELQNADDSKYPYKRKNLIERIEDPKIEVNSPSKDYIYQLIKEYDEKHGSQPATDYGSACPVCKAKIPISSDTCPICGYETKQRSLSIQEKVKLLNEGKSQIDNNPLYEYAVETIKDSSALGVFNKGGLQELLLNYSLNGWKLHTAFTKELGKNAVLGLNATIEETILIFERCIKPAEK